ncbi:hypothetical protein FRB99_006869 [Tulasnella sp. 403]|nr:hypothetical protein FRB99_006869 [Tulasnella sp. 403]
MPFSQLKLDIADAIRDFPDDGRMLESAFRRAGGTFGDAIPPGLEIVGFGRVPGVISPGTFFALQMRFSPRTGGASRNDIFIPADKLNFTNEQWHATVENILAKLNVQDVFRLELSGLMISCVGSISNSDGSLPSAEGPNVAGRLVVTLPSEFGGGMIRTFHLAREERFALEVGSAFGYGFAAFLDRALLAIEPINQGCRVALTYAIVHKTPPRIVDPTEDIANLRYILHQWRTRPRTRPEKLVYYLEDSFEMIDGNEEVPATVQSQMAFLEKAGTEEGFQFRVAVMTYSLIGQVREPDDGRQEPFVVKFDQVGSEALLLDDFRGADGRPSDVFGHTELQMNIDELIEKTPWEIFISQGSPQIPEDAEESDTCIDGLLPREGFYLVKKIFRNNVLVLIPPPPRSS